MRREKKAGEETKRESKGEKKRKRNPGENVQSFLAAHPVGFCLLVRSLHCCWPFRLVAGPVLSRCWCWINERPSLSAHGGIHQSSSSLPCDTKEPCFTIFWNCASTSVSALVFKVRDTSGCVVYVLNLTIADNGIQRRISNCHILFMFLMDYN